jgi:hypothetical protein
MYIYFQTTQTIQIEKGITKKVKIPMESIQPVTRKKLLMKIALNPDDPQSSHQLIVDGLQQVNDKAATVVCSNFSNMKVIYLIE